MAKYQRTLLNVNTSANSLKNFFESLDDRFVCEVSGTQLNIVLADSVTIRINVDGDYWRNPFSFTINGATSNFYLWGQKDIITLISDNLIYIHFKDQDGRRNTFIFEEINNDKFAGDLGASTMNVSFASHDIANVSMQKIGDSTTVFNHNAILNYTNINADTIDYINNSALFTTGIKQIIDPYILASSTIMQGSAISFQGSNYFAVGAHSLILIDHEAEE